MEKGAGISCTGRMKMQESAFLCGEDELGFDWEECLHEGEWSSWRFQTLQLKQPHRSRAALRDRLKEKKHITEIILNYLHCFWPRCNRSAFTRISAEKKKYEEGKKNVFIFWTFIYFLE